MKTQVFKNSETFNPGNTFSLVTLIVLSMVIYTVANFVKDGFNSNSILSSEITAIPESHIGKINTDKNITAENQVSAKFNEILVPAVEPTLQISNVMTIPIPDFSSTTAFEDPFINELKALAAEKVNEALIAWELQTSAENRRTNSKAGVTEDQFLAELKSLANARVKEALVAYEFQLAFEKLVKTAVEEPLALESWMTDEKCWCRNIQTTSLAMANSSKNQKVIR